MISKIRQEIIDLLLASKNVLVTAHRSPDGDSLGSQLGLTGFLASRGIPFAIVNEGIIPHKFRFLPGIDTVRDTGDLPEERADFDVAVVIECSTLDRIGTVRPLISDTCRIINIDHHPDNVSFGDINLKVVTASSAGELIFDILRQGECAIDRAMATNLYTAILTDTGRFHYGNTTPYCLKVAAHLLELGADPVEITEKVYYSLRPQAVRLTGMAVAGIQYLMDGRVCLLTVDRKMMNAAQANRGDTEGLVNYSLYADGVEMGVLFTELDDNTTKVSFRSQDDKDVADIAASFGGGGHLNASGCVIDLPLDKARQVIIKHIEDRLNGSV